LVGLRAGVYLDTSVLVARYAPETTSELVDALMKPARQRIIGSHATIEMVSALTKKVRDRVMSRAQAHAAHLQFQRDLAAGAFMLDELTLTHQQQAEAFILQIGFTRQIRTLDALHIAVAAAHGVELATSDAAMARAAQDLGVKVVHVVAPRSLGN